MKAGVVIFVLTIVGVFVGSEAKLTAQQKMMLQPIKEMCFAETGLNEETLRKERMEDKKKFKETGEISIHDEKRNCFTACMFKKIGFMSEEGELEADTVRALMASNVPADRLNAAIENCKNEVGKDHCETAGKIMVCFLKNNAEIGE